MLVCLDRKGVHNPPRCHLPDLQRARRVRDRVLLRMVHLPFYVMQPGIGTRRHSEANPRT